MLGDSHAPGCPLSWCVAFIVRGSMHNEQLCAEGIQATGSTVTRSIKGDV